MTAYPRGFTVGAASAGVKYGRKERLDVALIASDRPCTAAGVFTTNAVIAAPCVISKRHVAQGAVRAIVANSGNANACTGEAGEQAAVRMTEAAARRLGITPAEVAVASTGVIGVPLPVERIEEAVATLAPRADGWDDAAAAIITTDTRPKQAWREVAIGGGTVRIGGIAKGAGMIHPDMATLLSFVVTDVGIPRAALERALRAAAAVSFNSISVDGDTSTNDTLLVLANGASGISVGEGDAAFEAALAEVCRDLALQVVSDGEGVTKVFEVRVRGAATDEDARLAARTITNSNLVRTAIHGADPNWGRFLMAAGRSGARVDARLASVRVGDVAVFERGTPREFDAGRVRALFERPQISIDVDLGLGGGTAVAWGGDLSAEYVRINAEYTT